MKRTITNVIAIVSLTAWATAALGISAAGAQTNVSLTGRVLWVAADTMIVAPYAAVPAVNVDLSRAALDDYSELHTGDSVVVTGSVAPEGDRVIATSIRRFGGE